MSRHTADMTDKTVDQYHSYKSKGSEGTAREYRRHVRRYRDYLSDHTDEDLWSCHGGHAEDFYEWMLNEKGYAPSSVRVAHAALGDFYGTVGEFADKRGFPNVTFSQDPTEHASPERLDGMHTDSKKQVESGDKPLTQDEVRQLVKNVPPDKPVRNRLIVRMLYQTGMRRSELVRVKLDQIDRDDRRIKVYGKKVDESREVWYQPSLDDVLSIWVDSDRDAVFHAEDSEYLFPTRRSERMSEQTVTDVVTEAAERAGLQETVYETRNGQPVKRVGAHTLRKSFGVHFLNDGGDVTFLMDLLGHNDIETTKENYLNYATEDLRSSTRRHGPSL